MLHIFFELHTWLMDQPTCVSCYNKMKHFSDFWKTLFYYLIKYVCRIIIFLFLVCYFENCWNTQLWPCWACFFISFQTELFSSYNMPSFGFWFPSYIPWQSNTLTHTPYIKTFLLGSGHKGANDLWIHK